MSFHNPMLYNEILQGKGLLDGMYKAVSSFDGSAVMEAYKILSITKGFPRVHKHVKNYDRSCFFRNEGNTQYTQQNYHTSLEMYNKAILFAPKGSMEMLHAYGNRSALFFHLNAYSACIKDIETCRKLGCSGELAKKLDKRYDQCQQALWKEHLKNGLLLCNFAQEFFKFNVKRHPDIPCLSADVDIVSEPGKRRVIANKDIKVGELLGVETAFATYSLEDKSSVSCHYCQKMALNLIPCENCCFALFCSIDCKERCFKEYHNIECQITDILENIDAGYKFRLAIQAVLKLKNFCKTWSTFIKEASNIGASRLNKSSLNEIYDVVNYSSVLCFEEDRQFLFGTKYNSSFIYASVLQHLEKIKGFFPESKSESVEAKKCFGKLCLALQLNWVATEVVTSAEALIITQVVTDVPCHFGWFPFTGRLRHACEPNVLVLGLDNRVALVAVQPIKKNTELTISYIGHWYEHLYEEQRRMKLYQTLLNVCRCRVCEGAWGIHSFQQADLDPRQRKFVHSWEQSLRGSVLPQREPSFFRQTCSGLGALAALPNTAEHYAMFRELRTMLSVCQFAHTANQMIVQLCNQHIKNNTG